LVDVDDARTIGQRLRRIRKARDKPLVVIAGLAGMSKSQLDRIERGERDLDKFSEIVALANALQIAPGDLLRLPVPAPANGHTDCAADDVRLPLIGDQVFFVHHDVSWCDAGSARITPIAIPAWAFS
jgi:transcriptional regulator with XRE-family HTH domain